MHRLLTQQYDRFIEGVPVETSNPTSDGGCE